MPRARALMLALGLAVLVLWTPAAPAETTSPKRVLTVGIVNDIDSLNPLVGYVVEAYEVWGADVRLLTGYGQKDFAAVPGLAEKWTTSADGKTWTYTIRSGVTWSDGTPLTARDAAYTFNRISNGSAEQTNYGNYVANIVKAEAPTTPP
ncbi:MAG: hypothetical protein IPH03_03815 [Tetrasphaera sp.]|nr:hypothetical protein [Tetrasphaera sp.]